MAVISNAFTFLDWTSFFETLPADKIDFALRQEADRMFNCLFDPNEVSSERTVVISERQGSENEPLFRLSEEVQSAAFRVHPYHHEIIGDLSDLYSMERDDLYRHYRTYYIPNNAVLSIAGDFETQVDAWSASGSCMSRLWSVHYHPGLIGQSHPKAVSGVYRWKDLERRSTCRSHTGHPAADDQDFFALNLLDSLLTGPTNLNMFGGGITNKTSRLYKALVEKELAVSVNGGLQATIDPYLYTTVITVHPKHTASDCIAAMEAEIKQLQDAPPKVEELDTSTETSTCHFCLWQ